MEIYTEVSFTLNARDYRAYLLVNALSLNNANEKVIFAIDKISNHAENILSNAKTDKGPWDIVSEYPARPFKKVENGFSFNDKTLFFCLNTGEYITVLQLTNRIK